MIRKIFFLFLTLCGCAHPQNSQPTTKEPAETRGPSSNLAVFQIAWDKHPNAAEWSNTIRSQLLTENHKNLLESNPQDVIRVCPAFANFTTDERIQFWTTLTSEIARAQKEYIDNHDPRSQAAVFFNEHEYNESSHSYIFDTAGLMDLQISSVKAYSCDIDYTSASTIIRDLQNGSKNLACTLQIYNKLISKYNCVTCNDRGIASYFGPLRDKYIARGKPEKPTLQLNLLQRVLAQHPACSK